MTGCIIALLTHGSGCNMVDCLMGPTETLGDFRFAVKVDISGIIYNSGDVVFISGSASSGCATERLGECVSFYTNGDEFFVHLRLYSMQSRMTPHSARWRPSARYDTCSMHNVQLAYAWYADQQDLVAIAAL